MFKPGDLVTYHGSKFKLLRVVTEEEAGYQTGLDIPLWEIQDVRYSWAITVARENELVPSQTESGSDANVIKGRTALYRGFMIVILPTGMKAYRNPGYFGNNISSYEVPPDTDISNVIDDASDYGEFTADQFAELAGATAEVPTIDTCVGCRQQFPAEMLSYEGVEPVVYSPRCHTCLIKQAQDIFGAENVILPGGSSGNVPYMLDGQGSHDKYYRLALEASGHDVIKLEKTSPSKRLYDVFSVIREQGGLKATEIQLWLETEEPVSLQEVREDLSILESRGLIEAIPEDELAEIREAVRHGSYIVVTNLNTGETKQYYNVSPPDSPEVASAILFLKPFLEGLWGKNIKFEVKPAR